MSEPRKRCAQHLDTLNNPPCEACRTAAEAWRDWKAEKDAREVAQRRIEADARRSHEAREIAACSMCDDHGVAANGWPCHHNPEQLATNARGLALARAALGR